MTSQNIVIAGDLSFIVETFLTQEFFGILVIIRFLFLSKYLLQLMWLINWILRALWLFNQDISFGLHRLKSIDLLWFKSHLLVNLFLNFLNLLTLLTPWHWLLRSVRPLSNPRLLADGINLIFDRHPYRFDYVFILLCDSVVAHHKTLSFLI